MKRVARREFDIVAWSVCRLGRSLPDLIGFLGELQARDIGLRRTHARYLNDARGRDRLKSIPTCRLGAAYGMAGRGVKELFN